MSRQVFKVTEVCDTTKQSSEVTAGAILMGELDYTGTRIFYKDAVDCDWIFYVGDTCELITEETLKVAQL